MKVLGLTGRTYYWSPKRINWTSKSRSDLQFKCKLILNSYWANDIISEEQVVPGTKMRFDFVNFSKKIILEINGQQHYTYNKHFHKKNIFNYTDSINRDNKKKKFALMNDFMFLEVRTPEELTKILIEMELK
jgi:hypothetical protein